MPVIFDREHYKCNRVGENNPRLWICYNLNEVVLTCEQSREVLVHFVGKKNILSGSKLL